MERWRRFLFKAASNDIYLFLSKLAKAHYVPFLVPAALNTQWVVMGQLSAAPRTHRQQIHSIYIEKNLLHKSMAFTEA